MNQGGILHLANNETKKNYQIEMIIPPDIWRDNGAGVQFNTATLRFLYIWNERKEK
jgi:hypothetical protein